jgi:hypothetical protein
MNHDERKFQRLAAVNGDVLHPEYTCLDISEAGMKFHALRAIRVGIPLTLN